MQRFWVQSFPDPGRRRIKWQPADRVGYETRVGGQQGGTGGGGELGRGNPRWTGDGSSD